MAGDKEVLLPHLATAVLCERVLHEGDGVLSAIRIVDQFSVKDAPADSPPLLVSLLVMVKPRGDEREEHTLHLTMTHPSGDEKPLKLDPVTLNLSGGAGGASFISKIGLPTQEAGLYYVNVLIGEERITRVPFKLLRNEASTEHS